MTGTEFVASLRMAAANSQRVNYTEALQECVGIAAAGVTDNFSQGGSPEGAWPPRKHIGDGHPLLMDTLALFAAATGHGKGSIVKITANRASFGVSSSPGGVPYAAAHQFGAPGRNLPARPFLVMSDARLDQMEDAVADTFEEFASLQAT